MSFGSLLEQEDKNNRLTQPRAHWSAKSSFLRVIDSPVMPHLMQLCCHVYWQMQVEDLWNNSSCGTDGAIKGTAVDTPHSWLDPLSCPHTGVCGDTVGGLQKVPKPEQGWVWRGFIWLYYHHHVHAFWSFWFETTWCKKHWQHRRLLHQEHWLHRYYLVF